jgi:hypothetical protein
MLGYPRCPFLGVLFFFSGACTSKQYDLLKVLRFIQGYSGFSFRGCCGGIPQREFSLFEISKMVVAWRCTNPIFFSLLFSTLRLCVCARNVDARLFQFARSRSTTLPSSSSEVTPRNTLRMPSCCMVGYFGGVPLRQPRAQRAFRAVFSQ